MASAAVLRVVEQRDAWLDSIAEECLAESADTARLSVQHAPIGKGGSNYVTRSKPGNTGQYPAYIQNVRNAIIKTGKSVGEASAIAISRVRAWARGEGNVGPEVKAASAKAIAELEAIGAQSKAKTAAKAGGRLGEAFADAAPVNPASGGVPSKTRHAGKGTGGGRFISDGSSGADVRAIQRKVGADADGQFGKHTESAVRAFQRKHGLKVDGIVGRQTIAALAGDKHASEVKPGALSSADKRDLTKVRTAQTRRRARSTPALGAKPASAQSPRTITRQNGQTQTVTAKGYRRLRSEGKVSEAFNSAEHPRNHGKFARKPGGQLTSGGGGLFSSTAGEGPSKEVKPLVGKSLPKARVQRPIDTARKRKLSEDELPRYVQQTPKRKVSAAKAAREIADRKHGAGEDASLKAHTGPDGKLTPERLALHKEIIELSTRHAHSHVGENRAIFLAGGGASGKSTVLNSGLVDIPHDAVVVNPDIVKTMLPEYGHLLKIDGENAANAVHGESSELAKQIHAHAERHGFHVIVDGVGGGKTGKFAGKVAKARDNGAKTEVIHVTVPVETALEREKKRALRSGRKVPEDRLRAGHRESARSSQEVQGLPGVHARVIDNGGKTPKLIAEKSPAAKRYKVLDQQRYDAFLAKARESTSR